MKTDVNFSNHDLYFYEDLNPRFQTSSLSELDKTTSIESDHTYHKIKGLPITEVFIVIGST